MVPVKPSVSQIPNWQKDPSNVRYDEQIEFDFKVRNKDTSASIILDLKEKKIVTNRLDPKLTYEQSFEYFYKAYKTHIDQVLNQLKDVS